MRASSTLAIILTSLSLSLSPSSPLGATVLSPAKEVYRLSIVGANGVDNQPVDMIIERSESGISGFLLARDYSAVLESARLDEGVLRATVMTTLGKASLSFHPFVDHPYGALTVGAHTLAIRELGTR
jgi:hypothetical protein